MAHGGGPPSPPRVRTEIRSEFRYTLCFVGAHPENVVHYFSLFWRLCFFA